MLVINYSSKEQSYIQIKEYNSMVCEYFDGENFDDTINYFQKYNLRLTIFDENFELIVDTGILNDLGDVRPELNDLGNIYTRYSTNLDQDMLYLANYDDGYFIRVSIEVSKINTLLYQYITIGILFLFIILLISIVLSLYLLKKTMLPINNVVNQLGSICGSSNLSIDNEASITKEINKIKFQIEEKFNDIQTEKLKLEGILEASNEGIIVIDISNNIQIINTRALAIFNLNNNVLNNSYYSLLKSKELTENIKTSLENKCNNNGITFIDNFVYNISIIYVNNAFIEGLLVTLGDITTDYNLAKVKKDFFQNASHELKSPLTSILGYQQLIKEGIYETKEDIIDGVTCTIKEANKMNKLIIDMLELSQLESEYKEEVSNINIKLIVEEVIKSFKLLIK